jgi:hypothetical protein
VANWLRDCSARTARAFACGTPMATDAKLLHSLRGKALCSSKTYPTELH